MDAATEPAVSRALAEEPAREEWPVTEEGEEAPAKGEKTPAKEKEKEK